MVWNDLIKHDNSGPTDGPRCSAPLQNYTRCNISSEVLSPRANLGTAIGSLERKEAVIKERLAMQGGNANTVRSTGLVGNLLYRSFGVKVAKKSDLVAYSNILEKHMCFQNDFT